MAHGITSYQSRPLALSEIQLCHIKLTFSHRKHIIKFRPSSPFLELLTSCYIIQYTPSQLYHCITCHFSVISYNYLHCSKWPCTAWLHGYIVLHIKAVSIMYCHFSNKLTFSLWSSARILSMRPSVVHSTLLSFGYWRHWLILIHVNAYNRYISLLQPYLPTYVFKNCLFCSPPQRSARGNSMHACVSSSTLSRTEHTRW